MAMKRITISLEAFEALTREKREGETYSELLIRLAKERGTLAECLGLWSDLTDEQMKVFDEIGGSNL
jgi:predicted CopG family antitoxin